MCADERRRLEDGFSLSEKYGTRERGVQVIASEIEI